MRLTPSPQYFTHIAKATLTREVSDTRPIQALDNEQLEMLTQLRISRPRRARARRPIIRQARTSKSGHTRQWLQALIGSMEVLRAEHEAARNPYPASTVYDVSAVNVYREASFQLDHNSDADYKKVADNRPFLAVSNEQLELQTQLHLGWIWRNNMMLGLRQWLEDLIRNMQILRAEEDDAGDVEAEIWRNIG
ncbi:hypothetical protein PENNAL_c0024G05453 [Penicillium nalgiovense]|uniref:Uncharacterized protein n=1 Tax=Penicillium nalgiovense TaxID=60175 RepID=A0A1V6YCM8_PENNA|nr:hypothetical protein PENNAL_c0024G05453 [Penicillium nalgiovense]